MNENKENQRIKMRKITEMRKTGKQIMKIRKNN